MRHPLRHLALLLTLGAAASALATPHTLNAQGQVVGPGGSVVYGTGHPWLPWTQAGGYAQVTMDNPRFGFGNVGQGSLRLSVTGQQVGGEYPDWAFWYRYAGGTAANSMATLGNGGSFGSLSALSQLSFDWFRVGFPGWNDECGSIAANPAIPPCDWAYKTPVLRLQLAEDIDGALVQTELIWEGYFNQQLAANGGIGGTTPVDQWVTSNNLQLGNFWYVRPAVGSGGDPLYSTTGGPCALDPFSFWQGNAQASALDQLLGTGGCISGNAQVIGVAVGVGSQWPLEYLAFADNVRLGFDGQNVLDANFDYVVPEPSALVLLAMGLVAMGAVARRRR